MTSRDRLETKLEQDLTRCNKGLDALIVAALKLPPDVTDLRVWSTSCLGILDACMDQNPDQAHEAIVSLLGAAVLRLSASERVTRQ